jgi:hypothetical protein
MKPRAPRKKKKKAKKLKASNDAFVMVRTALITASASAQLAIVSSSPFTIPALRALKAAQVAIDTTKSVSRSLGDIKHWTNFVPNYKRP